MTSEAIDIAFNFWSDTPFKKGADPDSDSPTLRRYHQLLWSKPLPDGTPFDLDVRTRGTYLHHASERGEFGLSSDAVIPTYCWRDDLKPIFCRIPEEVGAFYRVGYTIGGMMVFPGYKVDNKMTLNQARGCRGKIRDRFDLTLECIRRHYLHDSDTPLGDALARYSDFFSLFESFEGYVDFFLLQDLVHEDSLAVRFSLPFESFHASPVPSTLDDYIEYMRNATEFIESRNRRIHEFADRSASRHEP